MKLLLSLFMVWMALTCAALTYAWNNTYHTDVTFHPGGEPTMKTDPIPRGKRHEWTLTKDESVALLLGHLKQLGTNIPDDAYEIHITANNNDMFEGGGTNACISISLKSKLFPRN